MTSDLDVFRSANLLVKQHGQDAPVHAAMRADALLDKGDLGGVTTWQRIMRATNQRAAVEGTAAGSDGAIAWQSGFTMRGLG